MSQLKTLFNKVFMKLTKGRQFMLISQDELIVTESDLKQFVAGIVTDRTQKLTNHIKEFEKISEKKQIDSYHRGLKEGLKRNEQRTLVLPSVIKEDKKHLADIIGLIAEELFEQGDSKSCIWLYQNLHKCRSL